MPLFDAQDDTDLAAMAASEDRYTWRGLAKHYMGATRLIAIGRMLDKVRDWIDAYSAPNGSGTAGALVKWSDSDTLADSLLVEGADLIEQKRAGNFGQTWRLFNKWNGADAEWLQIDTNATTGWRTTIGNKKSGTGVVRDLAFETGGSFYFQTGANDGKLYVLDPTESETFTIDPTNKYLLPTTDGEWYIGDRGFAFKAAFISDIIQGGRQKTLVNGVSTKFARLSIAAGTHIGGYVEYTLLGSGSDGQQGRFGFIPFGAVSTSLNVRSGGFGTAQDFEASSAGSLTATAWTMDLSIPNYIDLAVTVDSSGLTSPFVAILYRIITTGLTNYSEL